MVRSCPSRLIAHLSSLLVQVSVVLGVSGLRFSYRMGTNLEAIR